MSASNKNKVSSYKMYGPVVDFSLDLHHLHTNNSELQTTTDLELPIPKEIQLWDCLPWVDRSCTMLEYKSSCLTTE